MKWLIRAIWAGVFVLLFGIASWVFPNWSAVTRIAAVLLPTIVLASGASIFTILWFYRD